MIAAFDFPTVQSRTTRSYSGHVGTHRRELCDLGKFARAPSEQRSRIGLLLPGFGCAFLSLRGVSWKIVVPVDRRLIEHYFIPSGQTNGHSIDLA